MRKRSTYFGLIAAVFCLCALSALPQGHGEESKSTPPNLRFSLSEDMLARLLPQGSSQDRRPVNGNYMGRQVRGEALSNTSLRVRLAPGGTDGARLQLEVHGTVTCLTSCGGGMITAFNQTDARFVIHQLLEITPAGVRGYRPRVVSVAANSRLNGLQTGLDPLPMAGGLSRAFARMSYSATDGLRQAEVRQRVATAALRQFEAQSAAALAQLNARMQRVLVTLRRLDVQPQFAVGLSGRQRLSLEARVAGRDPSTSPGPCPPRPPVPGDSLANLQVHESLINNVLDRLELSGRRLTLAELRQHVCEKLNLPILPATPEDAGGEATNQSLDLFTRQVHVTLAQEDPLRVQFDDDRLQVAIALAKVEAGSWTWDNLQVLVGCDVQRHDATVRVVQQKTPSAASRGIRLVSHSSLETVLTGILDAQKQPLQEMWQRLEAQQFPDVQVTETVAADGWLSISLGPAAAPPHASQAHASQ